MKLGDKILDLEENSHKSLILLLFSIISLGLFMIFQKINLITTLHELVVLVLWFFLWEYADLALLQRSDIYISKIEAGQLSTAKVVFLDDNDKIENKIDNLPELEGS